MVTQSEITTDNSRYMIQRHLPYAAKVVVR
jgi:hypothetical protein